jgi:hypothetical protein
MALSLRQEIVVRLVASRKAVDRAAFEAYVTDATAGSIPTDKQFRTIVDRALAVSRSFPKPAHDQAADRS